MPAPVIWGLVVGGVAVAGWLGHGAGKKIIEDVDVLGDVAIAGAVALATSQLSGSKVAGLLGGAATIYALGIEKDSRL